MLPKQTIQVNSFTKKFVNRIPTIITECGISIAFDPQKTKTPYPEANEYQALWDTGATGSVITNKVVEELQLKPTGKVKARGVNSEKEVFRYMVNILLPNKVGISGVTVIQGELKDYDILIGMDIITLGDFSISNVSNKTTFSFRIPSIKETDFVKEVSEYKKPAISAKVGRNTPCPCGSGKKYKHCHGK